jgi:hypothetical protein
MNDLPPPKCEPAVFAYDQPSETVFGTGRWSHMRLLARPTAAKRLLNKLRYANTANARGRKVDDEIKRVINMAVYGGLVVQVSAS